MRWTSLKNNYCLNFNVMVLNYVISSVMNFGKVYDFYASLIKNFLINWNISKPFVIVINDANHTNAGRDTLDNFTRWLNNFHKLRTRKFYFPYKNFSPYGKRYDTCKLFYAPDYSLSSYGLRNCTSAQMLIEIL